MSLIGGKQNSLISVSGLSEDILDINEEITEKDCDKFFVMLSLVVVFNWTADVVAFTSFTKSFMIFSHS